MLGKRPLGNNAKTIVRNWIFKVIARDTKNNFIGKEYTFS